MNRLRAACVFCGSLPGAEPAFVDAARELGRALARREIDLVYGGGHVGMMGALADSALAAGGRVIGVIPRHLMRPEVAHRRLTERLVVDSMHERKRVMAGRADAFIVLPGGFGTIEEMFEMLTWRQLKLHAKPIALVNVAGYFDRLLDFLADAERHEFIRPQHRNLLSVDTGVEAMLDRLTQQTLARPARSAVQLDRG
jgi:hypothetical protein